MRTRELYKLAPTSSRIAIAACGYFLGSALRSIYVLGWSDGNARGVDHMTAVGVEALASAGPQLGAATTRDLLDELRARTITLPGAPARIVELSEAFACITGEHSNADALEYRTVDSD